MSVREYVFIHLGLNIYLFDVLQVAIINPIQHYKLDVGLLRLNDDADFIIVNSSGCARLCFGDCRPIRNRGDFGVIIVIDLFVILASN